jgi:hypothetical protein
MKAIAEDDYSPLNKTLLAVFNAYKRQGFSTLFVFRDGWGDTLYAAVMPRTPAWEAFAHAAAPYGVKQPLIAFDLRGEYAQQMPGHFLETLETLDPFAFNPMIHIPAPDGRVPEVEKQRVIDSLARPVLSVVAGAPETSRRSPPSGKLRLV